MSIVLSSFALTSHRDTFPVAADNPRYDFFAWPFVEPYAQLVGPSSKHLTHISIALRVMRRPDGPTDIALRISDPVSGALLREAKLTAWDPPANPNEAAFPTKVFWRTFEFAPVGAPAADGLVLSVLPLSESASVVAIGLSRGEEIAGANLRLGVSQRELDQDLTFRAYASATLAQQLLAESLRRPPATILWVSAAVTFGLVAGRAFRSGRSHRGKPQLLIWWATAAWSLLALAVIAAIVWSTTPSDAAPADSVRVTLLLAGSFGWLLLAATPAWWRRPAAPAWLRPRVRPAEASIALGGAALAVSGSIGIAGSAEGVLPFAGAGAALVLSAILARLFGALTQTTDTTPTALAPTEAASAAPRPDRT